MKNDNTPLTIRGPEIDAVGGFGPATRRRLVQAGVLPGPIASGGRKYNRAAVLEALDRAGRGVAVAS